MAIENRHVIGRIPWLRFAADKPSQTPKYRLDVERSRALDLATFPFYGLICRRNGELR